MLEPFTIHHGPGNYWQIEIPHSREWSEQYYALGHEPPNYPVPATTRVDIGRCGIHIYNVDLEYTLWHGPLWSWRP